jgi:hypothetical protein
MIQTAVELLKQKIDGTINTMPSGNRLFVKKALRQAKEIEKIEKNKMCYIMQEFAAFCVKCDREKLPLLFAKEWFEQFKKK